ncbi:metallophosphoesterase family protein [Patescibacteria group bacterium]
MKIAIFSDVHGNLPAFETMLKNAGTVDQYVSLGDVVNYGPWSNECVQLLMSLKNCIKLKGNAEEYFILNKYTGDNKIAKAFFKVCIENFSEMTAIKSFKKEWLLDDFTLSHTIDNQYIYPDSKVKLTKNWIVGHSHYQFRLKSNELSLYNPGSVGLNRKYINVINYLIYDDDKKKIEMKNIPYNVNKIIKEMKARKYPDICIKYYVDKNRL